MKDIFFGLAMLGIPLAIVGWLIFLYGNFFWSLFSNWRFRRELDDIRAHAKAKRERSVEELTTRLDNGCEHKFGKGLGGFPAGVCTKCGLSKERPPGQCDHVWRRGEGGTPFSTCEKCGKRYSVMEQAR